MVSAGGRRASRWAEEGRRFIETSHIFFIISDVKDSWDGEIHLYGSTDTRSFFSPTSQLRQCDAVPSFLPLVLRIVSEFSRQQALIHFSFFLRWALLCSLANKQSTWRFFDKVPRLCETASSQSPHAETTRKGSFERSLLDLKFVYCAGAWKREGVKRCPLVLHRPELNLLMLLCRNGEVRKNANGTFLLPWRQFIIVNRLF